MKRAATRSIVAATVWAVVSNATAQAFSTPDFSTPLATEKLQSGGQGAAGRAIGGRAQLAAENAPRPPAWLAAATCKAQAPASAASLCQTQTAEIGNVTLGNFTTNFAPIIVNVNATNDARKK